MKSNARIRRALFTAFTAAFIALSAVCSASAQGTVHFRNQFGTAIDAPFQEFGANLIDPKWRVELLIGPNGDELAIAGAPVSFASPGYVDGGVVSVPGLPAGSSAFAQLRAWDTTTGPTYDSASYKIPSHIFAVTLGDGASPGELFGLGTTAINIIPEPASSFLFAAAIPVWLLLKRMRKASKS